MDNHGRMVLEARARLKGSPARRYFAYSTILDPQAFAEWRDGHGYHDFALPDGELAEALDVGLVFDFPSRFWGGRVAGLADRPGASVWGRLFEIPGEDFPIIQHKEGGITGMCVERSVKCRLPGGAIVEATAFATAPARRSTEGPISPSFLSALIAGAKAAALPPAWCAGLAELAD